MTKKIIILIVSLAVIFYILNYMFLTKNKELPLENKLKNIELKISERDSVINKLTAYQEINKLIILFCSFIGQ